MPEARKRCPGHRFEQIGGKSPVTASWWENNHWWSYKSHVNPHLVKRWRPAAAAVAAAAMSGEWQIWKRKQTCKNWNNAKIASDRATKRLRV